MTNDTIATESRARVALRETARAGSLIAIFVFALWTGWKQGLLYMALFLAMVPANLFVIRKYNPGLLRERMKKDRPTEWWDKFVIRASVPVLLALYATAALDSVYYHWSSVPLPWAVTGCALMMLGTIPITWSMATNPFLERTIRHQEERGHHAITTGPYRYVRHPMYLGFFISVAGWPLVLGSLWAYIPAALVIGLFVMRTWFEDRLLQRVLSGYKEYARATRYRLLPGIW